MFSVKNKLIKKLAALFLLLLFTFLLVWIITTRNQNYDPVETLKVEEATVRVYFSPELDLLFGSETYQGRIPDVQKHRFGEYNLILENTGKRKKNFVVAEMVDLPEFTKLIFNPETKNGYLPRSEFPGSMRPGAKRTDIIFFLAEGDPAEIEKLASQTKIRILWEEGGKKWEKIVPVSLVEFPKDYYCKEDKYEEGKTLELIEGISYISFSPDPNSPFFDWYKGRQPDSKRYRSVLYQVELNNTGNEKKLFGLLEPILDPSFQKLIVNSYVSDIPRSIWPGTSLYSSNIYYLAEGDPAEIEKLASKTKIRILWEEGGKKWEKIVPVTFVKVLPVDSVMAE